MCKKMPTLINFGAIRRGTRVEIAKAIIVVVVILLVLAFIGHHIMKSFAKCEGAFGDTVHLDLWKHPNYEKLYHGKCLKEYSGNNEDSKFPFIARFVYINETENMRIVFCSGSLISESLILTAAHCIEPFDYLKVEIHLGGSKESNFEDSKILTENDFTTIIHPKYDAVKMINDIALIKLNHEIKQSATIKRICIPLQDEEIPVNLTLPLWDEENTAEHPKIQDVFIKGVDLLNCSQQYFNLSESLALKRIYPTINLNSLRDEDKPSNLKINYNPISLSQFCAGEETRKRGNSGMPGCFRTSPEKPFTIYGILSYGTKEEHQMPTVFTKIYDYRHWILCMA